MSNPPQRAYPQRVLDFYQRLTTHLERRYPDRAWTLCLDPSPGLFPCIKGFVLHTSTTTSILPKNPSPFADPCFLSIVWWGDELTAINASLMFDSAKYPNNLDNKTFNLSDPAFLVSAYLDALASTKAPATTKDQAIPTPNALADARHQWDAYNPAHKPEPARWVGSRPSFHRPMCLDPQSKSHAYRRDTTSRLCLDSRITFA